MALTTVLKYHQNTNKEEAMSSGWTANGLLHMELGLERSVSLLERQYATLSLILPRG